MNQDIQTVLLRKMVDTLDEIREQLGQSSEARSHVQVNTSTRGWDITVKCYVGSPVAEAGDAAVAEYMRVRQMLEDALMGKERAA